MLNAELYAALSEKSSHVRESYSLGSRNFYVLRPECNFRQLRDWFAANDFNALCFTDSRSRYQFYALARLWDDIRTAVQEHLSLVHLCTPPVSAAAVYQTVRGSDGWENIISGKQPFDYDLHSRYAAAFGGEGWYLCSQEQELQDIAAFMRQWEQQGDV